MDIPEKFKQRMKCILKEEYDEFIQSYNYEKMQGIRVNTLKISTEEFIKICPFNLNEEIPWEKNGFYIKEQKPGKHPYHSAGLYYVQEPSAMSVVPALDIQIGDKVLDLCAAPGGKSTQAAAYLMGTGILVSNEIDNKRAKILSENIERMGIKNAVVVNNSPQELEKYFPGYFDKIIVDAPCSGEGMFKKEEVALDEWSLENVYGCSERQSSIIESAAKMLKTGGKMIYSTCTFSIEENEMVIESFLKGHKEFELINIDKNYGFKEGFTDESIESRLSFTARLFPHRVSGEGHFLALMTKLEGKTSQNKIVKSNVRKEDISNYYYFAKQNLNTVFDNNLFITGDQLFELPDSLCEVKGLRILRAGIHLGSLKKNRFEPNHALAAALLMPDFKFAVDFDATQKEVYDYLTGNILKYEIDDCWCGIFVNGYPLGFGKATGNVIKNHYPKGLRWNSITWFFSCLYIYCIYNFLTLVCAN